MADTLKPLKVGMKRASSAGVAAGRRVGKDAEEMRGEIVRAMPRILAGVIAKAEAGSYQHAKFLMECAGIELGDKKAEEPGKGSLAEMLIQDLAAGRV